MIDYGNCLKTISTTVKRVHSKLQNQNFISISLLKSHLPNPWNSKPLLKRTVKLGPFWKLLCEKATWLLNIIYNHTPLLRILIHTPIHLILVHTLSHLRRRTPSPHFQHMVHVRQHNHTHTVYILFYSFMLNILFVNPFCFINTNVGPITHPYYTS